MWRSGEGGFLAIAAIGAWLLVAGAWNWVMGLSEQGHALGVLALSAGTIYVGYRVWLRFAGGQDGA